jgi:SM-20-related protein
MLTDISLQDQIYDAVVAGLVGQGYAVVDHFLGEAEARALLAEAGVRFEDGDFKKAGIGREQKIDTVVRGDYIQWIDRERLAPANHFLLDRIEALVQRLNRACFLGIRDLELHFAVYPPGAGYNRHLDVFRGSSSRKLSLIIYLNFDWEASDGGMLRIFLPRGDGSEEQLDVLPLAGRMVCFESERVEHAVLPSRRDRYSITGWLKDSPSRYGESMFSG